MASASVYASITHWRELTPVSNSTAIDGSAVLTTAMSSMSIAVVTHTTASVARRVAELFGGVAGGIIGPSELVEIEVTSYTLLPPTLGPDRVEFLDARSNGLGGRPVLLTFRRTIRAARLL